MRNKRPPLFYSSLQSTRNAQISDVSDVNKSKIVIEF